MNLECLNDIITDGLAIHIDINDANSWNLNTGLTLTSLTKWSDAESDNLNLYDFGLTGFDNGRTNEMWSGLVTTPEGTTLSMYRVGYNNVSNPSTEEYSGVTVNTEYLPISAITSGTSGNHFKLDGGYLQGFFKLDGYNYELLPSRYNEGITMETLVYLRPDSKGVFYLMGARAEDKYNPYFSGETQIVDQEAEGVFTSDDNHLESIREEETMKSAFRRYEDSSEITLNDANQSGNTANNLIAFEITEDKKIAYKYIDGNNQIISNQSERSIIPSTGWTIISIGFTPDTIFDDEELLECGKQRTGDLSFYINGRSIWKVKDFPEYYFKSFNNDKEKQIGVPYNISWGGGSFGLEHSWHYDLQTYNLYNGNDQLYINNNIAVESNPFPDKCDPISGGTPIDGLTLSADSTTFKVEDECDSNVEHPITVMRVEHMSGYTGNSYFVKFNNPITVLSNRVYDINLDMYVDNFFRTYDDNNNLVNNRVSVILYGTEDIDIVDDVKYEYPLADNEGVTGQHRWLPIKTQFKLKDNSGKQTVYIGILIETTYMFNNNEPFYVKDFTYTGADILSKDPRKNNLLIQQNFNSSFNGGIQKLRIYDRGLTSQEILHNALIEKNKNSNLNLNVSKGGRIIYR